MSLEVDYLVGPADFGLSIGEAEDAETLAADETEFEVGVFVGCDDEGEVVDELEPFDGFSEVSFLAEVDEETVVG